MPRFGNFKALLLSLALLIAFAFTTNAQIPAPTPQVILPSPEREQRVADKSRLYCAGYIRHRGDVKGVHKQKIGFLGTYVQEVGQLQVFKVRENTSAAQITFTCDTALLGDLLAPMPDRESPVKRADGNLDVFADPSGKQTGRLIMAKDSRELVTSYDIVYIDLGSEDQIKR